MNNYKIKDLKDMISMKLYKYIISFKIDDTDGVLSQQELLREECETNMLDLLNMFIAWCEKH